jgi:small subunit ribosomal protein S8
MRQDLLADAFVAIKNSEFMGKRMCMVPASKIIKEVLRIMKENGYIAAFEFIEDGKSGKYRVDLHGRINDCNVIRPRYEVKKNEFIKWEKRFLPSVNVGLIFITTNKGIMEHRNAKAQNIGGALLGYIY